MNTLKKLSLVLLVFLMLGIGVVLLLLSVAYFMPFMDSAVQLAKSFVENPLVSKNISHTLEFLLSLVKFAIASALFTFNCYFIVIVAGEI